MRYFFNLFFISFTEYHYTFISGDIGFEYLWLESPTISYGIFKVTEGLSVSDSNPASIKVGIYSPTDNNLLGTLKYENTVTINSSSILEIQKRNDLLWDSTDTTYYINSETGELDTITLLEDLHSSFTQLIDSSGNPKVIQVTMPSREDGSKYYTYLFIPIIDTGGETVSTYYSEASGWEEGLYYCHFQMEDLNISQDNILTPEALMRLQLISTTDVKLHPENHDIYQYTDGTKTSIPLTLPRLNYYEKDEDGNNVEKYSAIKLLLVREDLIDPNQDYSSDDIIESFYNSPGNGVYISSNEFKPSIFNTQEKECHLMEFGERIYDGSYVGILINVSGDSPVVWEALPVDITLSPRITVGEGMDYTDHSEISPGIYNVKTASEEDIANDKISITINSDLFTGETTTNTDSELKVRRWIKIMKGEEEILPKTEVTTTYDENGKLITEVTEDYEENKISIKFPLKWLTGSVNPGTMEITSADYTIEIYQTEDARDPVSKPVIKMKDDPFVLKFYHHDHLGTVRYITNESGEILHTTDTLAYGEELTAPYEDSNDKVLNTITYTGHEKDYETSLTYMLARYYSQGYGRFLSPDPGYDYDQLDPMSWNLYAYVRGNPVAYADPSGTTIEVTSLNEDERERLIKELTRLANYKSKQKLEIVTEEKDGKVYLKFKDFDASKVNNVAKDLNEVMEDTKQNVRVIAANGDEQVDWMGSYQENDTIKIDFQDKFPKCLTMGMGMQFMHELVHIRKGWGDPAGKQPDGTFIPPAAVLSGYITGKVVDYVNERYRYPLGLSIRGGYLGSRDSSGRAYIPFYSGYNGITVIRFYLGKYFEKFDRLEE